MKKICPFFVLMNIHLIIINGLLKLTKIMNFFKQDLYGPKPKDNKINIQYLQQLILNLKQTLF